jgi:hypothetical protein
LQFFEILNDPPAVDLFALNEIDCPRLMLGDDVFADNVCHSKFPSIQYSKLFMNDTVKPSSNASIVRYLLDYKSSDEALAIIINFFNLLIIYNF